MSIDKSANGKITKRPFILKLRKKGLTMKEASAVYELFMETLIDSIMTGNEVILTGFGSFALRYHKGHRIQFTDKNDTTDGYLALKFATAGKMNKKLRAPNSELMTIIKQNTQKE